MLYLGPEQPLTLEKLSDWLQHRHPVAFSRASVRRMQACRDYLDEKIAGSDRPVYGVNTGFGYLQSVSISGNDLRELQVNLIQSHACGTGAEVPLDIVRLMLILKAQSLSFGHSGVDPRTAERLLDFLRHDLLPVIYTHGSLGASGDLAPLSHLSLPLIGMGEVRLQGKKMPAAQALRKLNLKPLELQPKEGIALINGTQFMGAYGIYNLIKIKHLLEWADCIAALSSDAFDCDTQPYQALLHQIRPHAGQIQVAHRLRDLLHNSPLAAQPKKQVQDPYSFRCVPQVHGAGWDVAAHVEQVFATEINSVTDNPNIFPAEDLILSGGNFHGQPLAMALDYLAIAAAETGSISERRTFQLISGQRGLPAFLSPQPGLHSGLMMPQYTAAGLVSANKQWCTPASVDSIVSSNGQEDHVSMGANAAVKCAMVLDNVERILAIELLTAAQALDFRRPAQTSPILEKLHAAFREIVTFNDADRILERDLSSAAAFIQQHQPKNFWHYAYDRHTIPS